MTITLIILAAVALAAGIILQHPAFGAMPSGDRKARILASKNYRDDAFQNLEHTPTMTSQKSTIAQLWDFLFNRPKDTTPKEPVEAVRTDLRKLSRDVDQIVWFGHSSYLLIIAGHTVLVDPVLTSEFPANLMMTPFKGADLYTPDDLPDIDLLVITHDHWDHLDYGTLRRISPRVGRVVAPLGVGAHLEKWGYGTRLSELDWGESATADGIRLTCLPARHFSGRLLRRAQSLWGSFMLEAGGRTIFIGGDSGFGKHFATIAERFPSIDVALLEDGQYDEGWAHIHTLPRELPTIIRTLGARLTIPVHNGKFALANHAWDEPTRLLREAASADTTLRIEFPIIGKPIPLP